MEQRKIIIVDSSTNRKVTVNTDATSFGELKRAARAAGINYEGKDWLEGLTKTSPVSDDSLLPVNVNYKGTITNNLVYMLTNTNKRIKSGNMTRLEAYSEIKRLGLQDSVKRVFGRNFTQVGTEALINFISQNTPCRPSVECNSQTKYETLVTAIIKFLCGLPTEILDDLDKAAPGNAVEEVDFSKMSVEELKKQFGC